MRRAICERCGRRQPREWKAGEMCGACGAQVRREVRCVWCSQWIPAGKFCRACGCGVVDEGQYGAARMLKAGGVDRFSIAARLRELDAEQVLDLARRYEGQLAAVERRLEEARLCEDHLLHKTHSDRLEEALIPTLPLEEDRLSALASGPQGPFRGHPELLGEIARGSPVDSTRWLASIALLRQGVMDKSILGATGQALGSPCADIATEAAMAFGHWRVRLHPGSIFRPVIPDQWTSLAYPDASRLVDVAWTVPRDPSLWPWAAMAIVLAMSGRHGKLRPPEAFGSRQEEFSEIRSGLVQGLSSSDPDLRFGCALALGDETAVARALNARDEDMRALARRYLAANTSPSVAPSLLSATGEVRNEILELLFPPLPEELVEPVLRAVEAGDKETRSKGAFLLRPSLTPRIVGRLIDVALREGDEEVLKSLLAVENLPESANVIRAIWKAGLFKDLYGALYDAASHMDFSDAVPRASDPETLEKLVTLAEKKLEKIEPTAARQENAGSAEGAIPEGAVDAGRFLARITFGDHSAEARLRAYRALAYQGRRLWNWMSAPALRRLFGSPGAFLRAAGALFKDPELHQLAWGFMEDLLEKWTHIEPFFREDPEALGEFRDALLEMVQRDYCGDWCLQWIAARILGMMADASPQSCLPAVVALLRDHDALQRCVEFPGFLAQSCPGIVSGKAGDHPALGELVDALLGILAAEDWLDRPKPAAAELLARIALRRPEFRSRMAVAIAPLLAERRFFSRDQQDPLEMLARALDLPADSTGGIQG